MTKLIICIVAFSLTTINACGQSTIKVDSTKISKDTEVNFYKTSMRGIESSTKEIFYVDENMQTLIALQNGQVKWRADIIKTCGTPFVGNPSIRYLKLEHDKISVVYGKHDFASVDITTGKIACLGAD